ncbi:putative RNA-binding Zn ribbon-like protein [Planotetraspora sp. GP83]
MPVTIDATAITSQQTFDSYVAEFAALALRLVNDLATERAHGQHVEPPSPGTDQLEVIRRALSAHDGLHAAAFGPDGAAVLAAAVRRLRAAIDACVDGDVLGAADVLNDLLAAHHAMPNLHGRPGLPLVLAFHAVGQGPVDSYIADMATSIAMIIGAGRGARLGRCSANECDRVFYDTTRNASRRFCDLSCQNRAKATAYRARRSRDR